MAQHVTYEEAMANLQTMFQTTDPSIISQILQQNRGHLERTVEQLLMMSDPSIGQSNLNVPYDDSSRRRSSAGDAPRVGGSNLPDDFMRPPSFFGAKAGSSQIDQDAILAQMLQDEMFMAEIRANPELYYDDQPVNQSNNQPVNQPVNQSNNQPVNQGYQAPSYGNQTINQPTSQTASRGDFTGMGAGGSNNQSNNQTQSFKDRWNGLTAAAKKRLLTVAGRMKSNDQSVNQSNNRKYRLSGDLDTGLLDSDADFPIERSTNQSTNQPIRQSNTLLGKKSGNQSSDAIHERDIELVNEVEDGVYVNDGPADDDDLSISQSNNRTNNRGYVPPAAKRWGQKLEDDD